MLKEWRVNKVHNVITSTGDKKKVNFLASILRLKPEDYAIEWDKDDLHGIVLDFFYEWEEGQELIILDTPESKIKNFCTSKKRKVRLLNGVVHYLSFQYGGGDQTDYKAIDYLLQVLNLEKSDLDYEWIKAEFEAGAKYLEQMDGAANEAIAIAEDADYQGWRAERIFEGLPDSISDYKDWMQEQEELEKLASHDSNEVLH